MATADDDLDFGGRVFLVDGFSAMAARIGQNFTALRGAFTRGVGALDTSTRGLQAALRRGAADLRTFAGILGGGFLSGVRAAQSAVGAFASGLHRADRFAHGFQSAVHRATAPLRRFGSELSAAFGGVGRYLSAGGLVEGLRWLGTTAVQAASRMENLRISFTTLLGSAEGADAHIRALMEFGRRTPFDTTQLVEQSLALQNYGFHVSQVIPLLTDFGNAAFVSGKGYAAVQTYTRVFGAILGANRMTFGQIGQLTRQGVPAAKILREQLHLTDRQVSNIARSGLGATRIIGALRTGMQQRFGGGMQAALQTITARVSNLGDTWELFMSLVGQRLRPVILPFLNDFARAIDAINMDRLATRLSNVLSVVTLVGKGAVAMAAILGGAVSDTAERWNGGTDRMARSWTESFGRMSDVLSGVVALLSTSNSAGVASIPNNLRDVLVKRGLWPITLQIARWGDRVRQIIGGFLDGFSTQLQASAKSLRHYAEAFGLVQPGMAMNRESARQLGEQLARLIRNYAELRVAMFGLSAASTVVTGAMAFGKAAASIGRGFLWAGGMLLRFVRWLPLAAAWIGRVGSFLRALGTVAGRVAAGFGLGSIGTILAIITAQVVGAIAVWRHWNALQRNTAGMVALRGLAMALLGPIYAVIHVIKETPKQFAALRGALARVGAWLSTTFARVGPVIGAAFRSAGSWVWRGLTTIFAPVGRALRLIGSFVVIALYLPFALLWAKIGPAVTRAATAAGRVLSRIGHAIGGFFVSVGHGIASTAASAGQWLAGLGRRAWAEAALFGRAVARGAVVAVGSVRGAFSRLGGAIGTFFRGLGGRAATYFAPMLSGVASFASALRSLLGGAFTWVASTAASAFSGLADLILSPLRFIARQLVMLFRGLPRNLQPAGLAGMVATLEGFGGGGGGPAGGAPPTPEASPPSPAPVPTPSASGAPAPGATPVPVSVRQQATAQSQGAARGPTPAPVVQVSVAPTPPPTVNLVVDSRVIASSVNGRNETEQLRQGR